MNVDSRGEKKTDLINLFKIFKRLSIVRIDLFMLDENTKDTRGHCLKLENTPIGAPGISLGSFSNKVVN